MNTLRSNKQRGYALLLMVLAFMGIGGVVLAGFTQQAKEGLDVERYKHNQRVLEQAKQALLMFAYNYPQTNDGGPGRLPCPDVDNDGTVDGPGTCNTVGRFPWADARLNIQETVDASGEVLWYAVSDAFDNVAGGGVINSDTTGTITLVDQTGGILYDGAVAGIAAVIIAPGPITKRDQDDNGTYEFTQLRNTGPQQLDSRNYLDTFNGFDNSTFTNGDSIDGFILGPIYDTAENQIVVNDELIIITADEVIAMAEKAVLAAYRDALNDYETNLPVNPGFYGNPWLRDYDVADLNIYDTLPGDTAGRVPFFEYFADEDSLRTIITDLQIGFDVTLGYTSLVENNDPFDPTYIDVFSSLFTGFPAGLQTVDISRANLSFSQMFFAGLPNLNDDDQGTIISQTGATAAVVTPVENVVDRYFWDGLGLAGFPAQDGWELCDNGGGTGGDCARDNIDGTTFIPFTGDWDDHADITVRLVRLTLAVDPDFVVELQYLPAPAINYDSAPTAIANARFTATFNNTEVPIVSVWDFTETNTRNFIDFTVICDQDTNVGSGLDLLLLGNPDPGTIDCTPGLDLDLNATFTLNNQFTITADYYPELPRWVAENDWDHSVMMVYAPTYAPGGTGTCTPEDGNTGTGAADDCLVITNLGGVTNNITSLLVIGGEHDLEDGDDLNGNADYTDPGDRPPDASFLDDMHDIFEPENYSNIGPEPVLDDDPNPITDTELPLVFDRREDFVPGNSADTVFVLETL